MKKRGSIGLMIVLILIGIFVGVIGGTFFLNMKLVCEKMV